MIKVISKQSALEILRLIDLCTVSVQMQFGSGDPQADQFHQMLEKLNRLEKWRDNVFSLYITGRELETLRACIHIGQKAALAARRENKITDSLIEELKSLPHDSAIHELLSNK